MIILTSIYLLCAFALAGKSPDKPLLNYTNLGSGNPFVLGKFYDPASVYFPGSDLKDSGLYWVFAATNIDGPNDTSTPSITAFSSRDLADWEIHENVLNMSSFPWANASVYSPSPVFSDGKYYLYFSTTGHPHYEIESFNDLSQNSIGNYSGIGVGVSHSPEGPYSNVLECGSPLIHADEMDTYSIPTSYNPYGPSILTDRDPQGRQRVYMYYGIQGNLYVRELDKIPATFKNDSDLDSARVFKRGDSYYLLWNNGASSPPQIRYSRTRNPMGPFLPSQDQQGGTLLQADPTVADNVYHADVLNIPSRGDGDGDDIWYLIYERMQSLPASFMSPNLDTHATAPNNIRGLAYDRMTFGGEYNHPIINPVEMQVKDNFQ
ncbi:Glycosyl hydrolase, five-bladed beta-propellor domain containing protein [Rhypophila decipiens]